MKKECKLSKLALEALYIIISGSRRVGKEEKMEGGPSLMLGLPLATSVGQNQGNTGNLFLFTRGRVQGCQEASWILAALKECAV
jgi:hypothetical protein